MQRLRNLTASILVAIAALIVIWWVLRRVIGVFLWLANLVLVGVVVVLLLVVANRLRKPRPPRF